MSMLAIKPKSQMLSILHGSNMSLEQMDAVLTETNRIIASDMSQRHGVFKITTDYHNNYTAKEVNDYLRSLIKTSSPNTLPDGSGLSNSNPERIQIDKESRQYQLAVLMVEQAKLNGVLTNENFELNDAWTCLAASNLETVKELIYSDHANRSEYSELMKLSGYQLYMDGKLERLKELSEPGFQLKYREYENYDARKPDNAYKFDKNAITKASEPENELETLKKLTADDLYFSDGKLERLKDLDFAHFKLMYKEIFKIEFI